MTNIEQTFWSGMNQLEDLAVSQYKKFVPELNISRKQKFLQNNSSVSKNLNDERLSTEIGRLVQIATKTSRVDSLLLQGFSLELLGQSIYKAVINTPSLSESSHTLAKEAEVASQEVFNEVLSILRKENLVGDSLFKSFISATQDVFGQLDSMGSLIDETFSDHSQLKFDDVLADTVTELLKHGTQLGMDRRKLLRQLTSALMMG
ncbi:hypothetical protein L0244_02650 [bacterium]|nr:hypothetical protein [bacterium]MCI0611867.1 hypothetical protein [bacterium]